MTMVSMVLVVMMVMMNELDHDHCPCFRDFVFVVSIVLNNMMAFTVANSIRGCCVRLTMGFQTEPSAKGLWGSIIFRIWLEIPVPGSARC